MRHNTINFANFVCKFGRYGNLLDYANEIVIPAFLDVYEARVHGDTSYYFIETELEVIDFETGPAVSITGRFVKRTILRRTQVLHPGLGLHQDEDSMETAPSSFFILRLDIHRLIIFGETPDAPDARAFALASGASIRRKYNDFIDTQHDIINLTSKGRVTKKSLRETHQPPSVVAVPLTTASTVYDFVGRYSVLQKIEFKLVRPNHELDGKEMWQAIRGTSENLGANSTTIEHRNSDGLDKDAAAKEIADASATGNQIIDLSGIDDQGNKLKGNNETYQLSVPLEGVPENRLGLIEKLRAIFDRLVKSGEIRFDQNAVEGNSDKINIVIKKYL